MTFVAYAVVLAVLGGTGVAFWMREEGGLPQPAPVQQMHAVRSLKMPPNPAPTEATKQEPAEPLAPAPAPEPAREPAASSAPSKSATTNGEPAAAAAERPEPAKPRCTAEVGAWPSDKTDQGKAIQILLRDLGFYSGNTYGTVGPATRAAIRKFETAVDQAETGEPTEMLFESLKMKCASPVR
jgi:hypothetical protein